jgi:DNA-damage-inducible protein D
MERGIAVFRGKEIRKTIHKSEWWFSIVDIIEVLTGGERPRRYWNDLKRKLSEEGYDELSEKIGQLKMRSSDGKYYSTDCANTETTFRIIQSIPSPKAEPFKRWLAKVGYERVQESEDPELARGGVQFGPPLHVLAPAEKIRETKCANTEGIVGII